MESTERNPYHVSVASKTPAEPAVGNRKQVYYGAFLVQMFLILATLLFGLSSPSIAVTSMPTHLLNGLIIFFVSVVRRDVPALLFASLEIIFILAAVAMIYLNSWTPGVSGRPLLYATAVYACVALPFGTWLTVKRHRENHDAG